ncbi:F0F1 ATP synthase subunit B' [Alphaproteobacteria bacterium]|nr:F0F1 ATP synthase subunit B' [Alphaproteobacteria bacterium]
MTVKNFIGANAILYFYIALGGAQVATASDASGPKLPQLDIETYASQIFWLIVTFIVLYFLVAKIAMPRIAEVLEGRQERIEDDLDKAETLKKEAYLVRVEYEKALSSAREEAHEATRRAQEEIAKHGAEVEALANQKVANMLKDAEDRIGAARTEASSKKETAADTLEQNVARDIIGDTVKKLVGIDVSAEDVNEAISLTLKGRGR